MENKHNELDAKLTNLDKTSINLQESIESNYDKLLVKIGDMQSNFHEQIEQAKMTRGGFGGRATKSEEESSKPTKVDENDLMEKLKNMDLQNLLGINKFKDSVDFDIRMLKDEYLEFKNKLGDKCKGLEDMNSDLEYKLNEFSKRVDELADKDYSSGFVKSKEVNEENKQPINIDLKKIKSGIHHSIVNSFMEN